MSALPVPEAGLVIRYSYLWRSDHERGQEEGVKDRPCAMILVTAREDGDHVVTVLPITHTPPRDPDFAVVIPAATAKRLKLDSERQWIVLSEANRFTWPGPDIRFGAGGDPERIDYGLLPEKLFNKVRDQFLACARRARPPMTTRTE